MILDFDVRVITKILGFDVRGMTMILGFGILPHIRVVIVWWTLRIQTAQCPIDVIAYFSGHTTKTTRN